MHYILEHATSHYANACGNTFWIVDCLRQPIVSALEWEGCKEGVWHSLKGLSVDDALVLKKIETQDGHLGVAMHVLEPDGTEANFCGNGARAVGVYLFSHYRNEYDSFSLRSRGGEHPLLRKGDGCLVGMGVPKVNPKPLPFLWEGKEIPFYLVDCVEPHLVTNHFMDPEILQQVGQQINRHWRNAFPSGINVNCFRVIDPTQLEVITFERGVYRITGSCGTGSTSCAAMVQPPRNRLIIKTIGGTLSVDRREGQFWLGGPVVLQAFDVASIPSP